MTSVSAHVLVSTLDIVSLKLSLEMSNSDALDISTFLLGKLCRGIHVKAAYVDFCNNQVVGPNKCWKY